MAVSERILDMADKIKRHMTYDAENCRIYELRAPDGASLYNILLPDGLTPEIVMQLKEYDSEFVAASVYAIGQIAQDALCETPTPQYFTTHLQLGGQDRVYIELTPASKVVTKLQPQNCSSEDTSATDTVTIYGDMEVVYYTDMSRIQRNTLCSVQEAVSQQIKELMTGESS